MNAQVRAPHFVFRAHPDTHRLVQHPVHHHAPEKGNNNCREAADELAKSPITVQLRYLQTLTEIATERTSTVVFPLPLDMVQAFLDARKGD